MSEIFQKRSYNIREQLGILCLQETFEFFDPEGDQLLVRAVEEPSLWVKFQKLFLDKGLLPLQVKIEDPDGRKVMDLFRAGASLWTKISAKDPNGKTICTFCQSLFSIGAKLEVYNSENSVMGTISSDWQYTNFLFQDNDGNTVARIFHKSGGLLKELFTTADEYFVEIIGDQSFAPMVLAGALSIDLIYHES